MFIDDIGYCLLQYWQATWGGGVAGWYDIVGAGLGTRTGWGSGLCIRIGWSWGLGLCTCTGGGRHNLWSKMNYSLLLIISC